MIHPAIRKHQLRDASIYWLIIPASVIFSGKGVDWIFGLPSLCFPPIQYVLSFVFFVLGLLLIRAATIQLENAGGTPNPLRPAKRLVTSGVYSLCRHPMFLGYDLCALAVSIFLGSLGMIILSYPTFLLLEIRFLRKEEKILGLKFKQTYAEYKNSVPFLIPFTFK